MLRAHLGITPTEEQRQICGLARSFAESELRPHAERRDREEASFDRAVVDQLGE
ncbi:MAG: acyl-CoA dehydrogenase family protein, partial [Gemmatimonadetes bacterium]|nr:acyl-CoA dehydrogenase family protein [Gemmatimonadota bacterium]